MRHLRLAIGDGMPIEYACLMERNHGRFCERCFRTMATGGVGPAVVRFRVSGRIPERRFQTPSGKVVRECDFVSTDGSTDWRRVT
jgi:hypothetical protein